EAGRYGRYSEVRSARARASAWEARTLSVWWSSAIDVMSGGCCRVGDDGQLSGHRQVAELDCSVACPVAQVHESPDDEGRTDEEHSAPLEPPGLAGEVVDLR